MIIAFVIGIAAFALAACTAGVVRQHPACRPARSSPTPAPTPTPTPFVLERLDPSDVTAARLLARRKEAHLADRVRWADRLCRLDVVG